jgi:hypothetical protein
MAASEATMLLILAELEKINGILIQGFKIPTAVFKFDRETGKTELQPPEALPLKE